MMNMDYYEYGTFLINFMSELLAVLMPFSATLLLSVAVFLLFLSVITRFFSTYKTLLGYSVTPTFVLNYKNGRCVFLNDAFKSICLSSSEEAKIAEHCFTFLMQRRRGKAIENKLIFIDSLNIKIRLSAHFIKYQRQSAWLCQIDKVRFNASTMYPWDLDGQILEQVLLSNNALIHVRDTEGQILSCSQSWAAQFDRTVDDIVGRFEADFYSGEKIKYNKEYDDLVCLGQVQQYEEWSTGGDANVYLLTRKVPLYDHNNNVVAILTHSSDQTEVTELKEQLEGGGSEHLHLELELNRENSLLNELVNTAPDPIAFMSASGRYIGANDKYCALFNVSADELVGMSRSMFIHVDKLEWQVEQEEQLVADGEPICYEELFHLNDGSARWYEVTKNRYLNRSQGQYGILIIFRDLTERKRIESELESAIEKFDKLSSIDSLTNIPNRRAFDSHLNHYWHAQQVDSQCLSLLFCDVDFFKLYNDNYGHQQGDFVLSQIANVMVKQVSRNTDIVARYGGEEFVVLLPNTDADGAYHLARKMLNAVSDLKIEHRYSHASNVVTLSIGIATTVPMSDSDAQALLDSADKALYQAKTQGRNQYSVFSEQESNDTLTMKTAEHSEFENS